MEKACTICKEIKPLTDFSTDKRKTDGRQSRCKACTSAYQKRYKREHPDKYKAMKQREYQKAKANGKRAAYIEKNRERINQWHVDRYANLSDEEREKKRAAHRKVSATYRERNNEICNERIAEWKKNNPGLTRHYVHVRRVKTRGKDAPERFTRQEIGDRDGWICGICGDPIDQNLKWPEHMSQSLDHIIPISLDGEHTRANSRITHYICNVRRGARVRNENDSAE